MREASRERRVNRRTVRHIISVDEAGEDVQGSARMGSSFGKTVLLVALLVLMSAACDGSVEVTGKSDNDIEPITTGQGEKKEDTSSQGEASVERVEVSTLVTNLEVPWS